MGTAQWAPPSLGNASLMITMWFWSEPAGNGLGNLQGPGGLGAILCRNIFPRYPNLTSLWTLIACSHTIAKKKQCGSGARIHVGEIS